jgi:hypothetical protein
MMVPQSNLVIEAFLSEVVYSVWALVELSHPLHLTA